MFMIFLTEVSKEIGMGHLMECLALAELLRKRDVDAYFIITPYPPAEELLFSRGISYVTLDTDKKEEIFEVAKDRSKKNIIVADQRNLSLAVIRRLREGPFKIVVIDHFGNMTVDCDLLINSAIAPEHLKYDFKDKEIPRILIGADFAILREEFPGMHNKKKIFNKEKKTVLVSMGGVDRTGVTLKVMEALRSIGSLVSKNIILGKGFAHLDRFTEMQREFDCDDFNFARSVDDMAERMQKSDLVISSGGNTLYETACVGTPGLVLWEDPHEDIQGRVFADKGVVRNLGNGLAVPVTEIRDSINEILDDTETRVRMSRCGKDLVDGQGAERILKDILGSA